jgi:hypothetical protein
MARRHAEVALNRLRSTPAELRTLVMAELEASGMRTTRTSMTSHPGVGEILVVVGATDVVPGSLIRSERQVPVSLVRLRV